MHFKRTINTIKVSPKNWYEYLESVCQQNYAYSYPKLEYGRKYRSDLNQGSKYITIFLLYSISDSLGQHLKI